MGTDSTTAAPTTVAASTRDSDLDGTAGQRILRHVAVFVACGYLGYLLLTLPAIAASFSVMHLWWSVPALGAVFGPGLAMGPLAWRGSAQQLRAGAMVATAGYLITIATWWFGWNGGHLTGVTDMWFSMFCGLAAIASAFALRPTYAFVVLVGVVTSTVAINHAVRDPAINGPLIPDMAWAFAFCLVSFTATVMAMRTAAVLDGTRADAYAATAEASALRARAVERRRFNQLTHDGVMSTLLVAARRGASPQLAQQASATLRDLASMRDGHDDINDAMSPAEVVSHIREVTLTADPELIFIESTAATVGDETVPGTVVRTVAAAAAEAVRNSGRHAHTSTPVAVAVVLTTGRLHVTISDDGRGFDPAALPLDRLGIAVSIRQRMSEMGGTAVIDSAPTRGTRVVLEWARV